jgi:hypothetical protein
MRKNQTLNMMGGDTIRIETTKGGQLNLSIADYTPQYGPLMLGREAEWDEGRIAMRRIAWMEGRWMWKIALWFAKW